jgi:hypothetical protein
VNGPIAQIAALVCHGNAELGGIQHPHFFPDNSTCAGCDRVEFVELRRRLFGEAKEHAVAATPDDWFELLKREGTLRLRLDYESSAQSDLDDRMSSAFVGGGGQWTIKTHSRGSSSAVWMARWVVWNQEAPGNRIWRVTYGKVGEGKALPPPPAGEVRAESTRLRDALARIAPFAREHDCVGFAECFEGALRILEGEEATDVYHQDLAPTGTLPAQAVAMLAACQKAWVFGGMGSWNDIGFDGDDQKEYERLSETLFQALNAAIVAATNASLVA